LYVSNGRGGIRRRALVESYFELGETAKAEALHRDWLQADPRWGCRRPVMAIERR